MKKRTAGAILGAVALALGVSQSDLFTPEGFVSEAMQCLQERCTNAAHQRWCAGREVSDCVYLRHSVACGNEVKRRCGLDRQRCIGKLHNEQACQDRYSRCATTGFKQCVDEEDRLVIELVKEFE